VKADGQMTHNTVFATSPNLRPKGTVGTLAITQGMSATF